MIHPGRKIPKFANFVYSRIEELEKTTDPASKMEEREFRKHAEEALGQLRRELILASDDYDFRIDMAAGSLLVEFTKPAAKFVVSPHAAARQIWVSANSRSYKLDWDYVENAFMLRGQTLKEILEDALAKHLGEEVTL